MKNESSDDACRDGDDRTPPSLTGKIGKAEYRQLPQGDATEGPIYRLTTIIAPFVLCRYRSTARTWPRRSRRISACISSFQASETTAIRPVIEKQLRRTSDEVSRAAARLPAVRVHQRGH
jgi:hypothetical protein